MAVGYRHRVDAQPAFPTDHYPSGEFPDPADFVRTLDDAVRALDAAGVPHLVIGGVGVFTLGRPRVTHDVDIFIRPDDISTTSTVLSDAGFDCWVHDPAWLVKATKRGALVDVVSRSAGDIYLDDEMLAHAVHTEYKGVPITVIGPEDLVVMKTLAATEKCPHHWYDALAVIARCPLDWGYVLARGSAIGPRRLLALLYFATSNDLAVPDAVIHRLAETIHRPGRGSDGA